MASWPSRPSGDAAVRAPAARYSLVKQLATEAAGAPPSSIRRRQREHKGNISCRRPVGAPACGWVTDLLPSRQRGSPIAATDRGGGTHEHFGREREEPPHP